MPGFSSTKVALSWECGKSYQESLMAVTLVCIMPHQLKCPQIYLICTSVVDATNVVSVTNIKSIPNVWYLFMWGLVPDTSYNFNKINLNLNQHLHLQISFFFCTQNSRKFNLKPISSQHGKMKSVFFSFLCTISIGAIEVFLAGSNTQ